MIVGSAKMVMFSLDFVASELVEACRCLVRYMPGVKMGITEFEVECTLIIRDVTKTTILCGWSLRGTIYGTYCSY